MQIVHTLDAIPHLPAPIGLTIGTFDGVHLGHQALIATLKNSSHSTALLTFPNHPLEVLAPHLPLTTLTPLEQKIALFSKLGLDLLILLPFTPELAALTYRDFILLLRKHLPFDHLFLGEGAKFGKKGEGDQTRVTALAQELCFKTHYLPKIMHDGAPISSQRIRNCLKEGHVEEAKFLLGNFSEED